MKNEIWKPILGYENLYEISSFGRVKSLDRITSQKSRSGKEIFHPYKGVILKIRFPNNKYPYIHMSKNGKYKTIQIHRLVAEAFVDNYENKPEVNHIDGDKNNNNVSNLEWVTSSENKKHAINLGLKVNLSGEKSHAFKGKIEVLDKNNRVIKILSGKQEINKFGFSDSGVSAVINGRYKTHRGYKMRRVIISK